jgi:hypothetical protein
MITPKKRLAHIAAAVGTLALGGALTTLVAAPASAARGVDITGWCQAAFGSAWHGVVVANNVDGWRCQYGQDPGGRRYVDMSAACWRTYGASSGAYYLDYGNPYSWRCY